MEQGNHTKHMTQAINKLACAVNKDSDQPGHLPSLIRVFTVHEEAIGPWLPSERTEKTDLIRLI